MKRHLAWPSRWTTAALLAVALAAAMITPAAAAAPASTAPACDNYFGTKTPVLLVHGFHEGTDVWKSMTTAIKAAIPEGVAVVPPFDYPSTQWVINQNVGAALASDITCLATDSKKNGGPGKIIIVAHSMGGLAVRCALDPTCVGKDHEAAPDNQIGLLVTMDTPNLGSLPATTGDVLSDAGGITCDG